MKAIFKALAVPALSITTASSASAQCQNCNDLQGGQCSFGPWIVGFYICYNFSGTCYTSSPCQNTSLGIEGGVLDDAARASRSVRQGGVETLVAASESSNVHLMNDYVTSTYAVRNCRGYRIAGTEESVAHQKVGELRAIVL